MAVAHLSAAPSKNIAALRKKIRRKHDNRNKHVLVGITSPLHELLEQYHRSSINGNKFQIGDIPQPSLSTLDIYRELSRLSKKSL
jgi:hypothetical protein